MGYASKLSTCTSAVTARVVRSTSLGHDLARSIALAPSFFPSLFAARHEAHKMTCCQNISTYGMTA